MKKTENKKKTISVSLNPEILKLLNEKTSNRSNYLDWALLEYFRKNGIDISKIKLQKMGKKLTNEEFIKRSKLIHKDKYDYSLVNYVNYLTKVKIICSIHG